MHFCEKKLASIRREYSILGHFSPIRPGEMVRKQGDGTVRLCESNKDLLRKVTKISERMKCSSIGGAGVY